MGRDDGGWTYWECGACERPWYRCGCDEPQPTALRHVPAAGRCDRFVADALAEANETGHVGALLGREEVWNWLAHRPGPDEVAYGAVLYRPPQHSVFLSGVECDFTRSYAGRHDLGILVQPGTGSYVAKLGAYGRWAADNGCFSKGASFDVEAWKRWVATLPTQNCLFVVAPDVYDPVAGRGDPAATWANGSPTPTWSVLTRSTARTWRTGRKRTGRRCSGSSKPSMPQTPRSACSTLLRSVGPAEVPGR